MLSAWSATTRTLLDARGLAPEALRAARWLHVVAPSQAEKELLAALGVPPALLAHALDEHEVARVDHGDGALLVVIRVPRQPRAGGPWRTAPLGVLVVHGLLVTVCAIDDDPLPHVGLPALDGGDSTRFVLRLLERVAAAFLDDVRAIDDEVDDVEARLQDAQENAEVRALLRLQKGLVHFETALRSNQIMLDRLRRDARFPKTAEDEDLLEDVEVELRQASEMTSISAEILAGMMDAYASIISNNLNIVMKRLTSLTLLVSIPTVIASFYGMNVGLPLAQHPLAFFLAVLLSAGIVAGIAGVFRARRWL